MIKNRIKIAASCLAVCLVAGLVLINGGAAKADPGDAVIDCNFDDGVIAEGIYGNSATLTIVDNMNSNVVEDGSQTGTGTDGSCVKVSARNGYWENSAFAVKMDMLEVGKKYTVTFDVYHTNGEVTASGQEFGTNRALIIHYMPDWQQIGQPNTAFSESWERVSWDFTLTKAAEFMYLEFAYPEATDNNNNNSYTIQNKEEYYIDNFSIKEYVEPEATPEPTAEPSPEPQQQQQDNTPAVTSVDIPDGPELEIGAEESDEKGILLYKVTSNTTVTLLGFEGDSKSKVTIPDSVILDDYPYQVTAIANNAFKNCGDLKTVTIGVNVTNIGKNAFNGCTSLKKITIKSTKIKKFGKASFKKTAAKATVKVPKKNKKAYAKALKKAGLSKKAKVK